MRKDIRRLAIFVIWDKDGTVDEYVKYYIESLLKAVSRLIIVSNAALDDENYRKLTEYSEEVYVRENKGFDAGAYQYVIQDILNDDIALYDEIVLSNDTCYGPFIPFDVIFESMEGKDVDFWGLNYIDNNFLSHLQSYFLVFRRRALPKVVEFFDYKINRNTIRLVNLYSDFEFGIYKFLLDAGFRPGHLVPFNNFNIYKSPNYCIRDFHLPFMKKKCFSSKYYERDNCVAALKYIESHSDYSIEYILQNAKRLYNIEYDWESERKRELQERKYIHDVITCSAEEVERFCAAHGKIFIYGAGIFAHQVLYRFKENMKAFGGFIISDDQTGNNQEEEPVIRLSEVKKDAAIIIGLDKKNTREVKPNLKEYTHVSYLWSGI